MATEISLASEDAKSGLKDFFRQLVRGKLGKINYEIIFRSAGYHYSNSQYAFGRREREPYTMVFTGTIIWQIISLTHSKLRSYDQDFRTYAERVDFEQENGAIDEIIVNYGTVKYPQLGLLILDPDVEHTSAVNFNDLELGDFLDGIELWYRSWFESERRRRESFSGVNREILRYLANFDNRVKFARALYRRRTSFKAFITQAPSLELTAYPIPSPHLGFALVTGGTPVATVGAFARNLAGEIGAILPLHAIPKSFTIGGEIYLDPQGRNSLMTIKSMDVISDSVFATFDEQEDFNKTDTNGPLMNKCPRGNENVEFEGLSSSRKSTFLDSWGKDVPFVRNYSQLKIYTPAVTSPGDSGAALINEDDYILGFAFYRTGVGQFPQYSAWIWAHSVYSVHDLLPI